jgi:hypothetical protein
MTLPIWLPALALACSPGPAGLAGDWVAAFYRGQGAPTAEGLDRAADSGAGLAADSGAGPAADSGFEPLPACEGDVGAENFRAWVRVDETNPVQGAHLSLYPDGAGEERPAADNGSTPSSGMSGLVTGQWADGVVQLDLVPDLDHAFATEQDREAWREHHLMLRSEIWGDRCWTARWAWVDAAGEADPVEQGLVFMRRQ